MNGSTLEIIVTILAYAALGAVYGASGYAHSVADGEKRFNYEKFGTTVVIGGVAGAIVAFQNNGDGFDGDQFDAVMATLVPISDQLYNALRDEF